MCFRRGVLSVEPLIYKDFLVQVSPSKSKFVWRGYGKILGKWGPDTLTIEFHSKFSHNNGNFQVSLIYFMPEFIFPFIGAESGHFPEPEGLASSTLAGSKNTKQAANPMVC